MQESKQIADLKESEMFKEFFDPLSTDHNSDPGDITPALMADSEEEEKQKSPMPFIELTLRGTETKEGRPVKTLIDPGSLYNLMSVETALTLLQCD